MSQAPRVPTEFLTEYSHSPPLITQFSVYLENQIGCMHDLLALFEDQPIRIVGYTTLEASDYAVVRVIAVPSDIARRLLSDHKVRYSETELLVIELNIDQRLSHLCCALLGAELNIRYTYTLSYGSQGANMVGIRCDDQTFAGQVLQRKGFKLVDEEGLRNSPGSEYYY